MKRIIPMLAMSVMALFCVEKTSAQTLAFPGAEGFGKYAVGGRYGTVYHVTNLNDSGTGSLRDAVSTSNRIVVFDVAGVINLSSRLVFKNNLYVAGQTAPGEGVIVYGDGVSFSGATNTIVRYMRFRMGSGGTSGADAAGAANGTNMIFDHLSVSWGRDETFSISPDNKGDLGDITIQNSIISQGLLTHSAGGLVQANNITLYRNLYIDNATRNAKIKGKNQYVNNIVYNWKNAAYIMGGDSESDAYCNAESSLFIKGPTGGTIPFSGGNDKFHIYADGNYYDNNRNGMLDPYLIPQSEYSGITTFQTKPYDYPEVPTLAATALVDSLEPTIGASLPYRDRADHYVLDELLSFGTDGGLISTESQLIIGIPTTWGIWTGAARTDTDGDGMPDAWESANGTDPAVNDAMTIAANGYANIENYINSITVADRQFYLSAPICFDLKKSAQNSLTLSWFDYTEGEEGFIIEMLQDGSYTAVDTVAAGVETVLIEGLTPATSYTFRMRAFCGSQYSAYSDVLTVKTQPMAVDEIDVDNYTPDYIWTEGNGVWDSVTANWNNQSAVFADSASVLFAPISSEVVSLNSTLQIAAMVVKDDGTLTLTGSGVLAGGGSVNKAGDGTFKMSLGDNTYKGASVLSGGVFQFATLKNGGVASSIGASDEFAQNWVWKGGVWKYTGSSTSTNRAARIDEDTEFNITNANATVSLTSALEGSGGLILNGSGKLAPTTPFAYTGATTLKGGTLYIDGSGTSTMISEGNCIGSSSKLVLAGGTFKTAGLSSSYESYSFPIEVNDNTYSYIAVNRNCSIKSTVSGSGTVEFQIPYVREYITGDWTNFTGILVANGVGSDSDGSQLLLDNKNGFPNTVVQTKGNTRIVYWETNGTLYLGGLSGVSGTYLSASSKNTTGAKMNWIVGGAGTDETFRGVIDNRCSAAKYNATTSIVKEGDGYWRLTGTNIYSGTTGITGGKLIVNGTHSGTGKITVYEGGTLAGTGTLAGAVAVQSGGTVTPGDTLVNSAALKLKAGLTLSDGAIVRIPIVKSAIYTRKNNKITVTGALVLDGKLSFDIDTVYHFVAGDYYDIFDLTNVTSISGSFDNIEPSVPCAGLKWDLSQLTTKGRVYVRNENYVALDLTEAIDVNLYPTQVKEVLHIETPTGTPLIMNIYNAIGKQMASAQVTGSQDLDMSAWDKGLYIFRLEDEKGQVTVKKIIKY